MTDADALLRAVCDAPDDDVPRLVYADWCDEHGRAERAEFIRLQCEAREYVAAFPDLSAARTRASDLLRARRGEWLAELPDLPAVEWGGLWVRGFLDAAALDGLGGFSAIEDTLFYAAPVAHLYVTEATAKTLSALFASRHFGRLLTLSLRLERATSTARRQIADARRRYPGTRITLVET